jgi:tetratricopeptide (TPR) repeat protein
MSDVLARLRIALADRYVVERELGHGGMATVYLAEDRRHHRRVAIKVLREELAVLGPERFLREIAIAAQLQHPHILPLYDSGEADGLVYYVMPYVEGESLSARLAREGALPIEDVVRLLREIADALAYAHGHGVIHRDIKPANVMISGSHALVTDFGVAKAVHAAAGDATLTGTGMALGTPAYMAPEQAMADPGLDHRADLYAVGVLAYEMLTGRPPFQGPTAQTVIAAHLSEPAVLLSRHRPSVPPALEALVMRCLEKLPADRVQRTTDLLHELEAMSTPGGGIPAAVGPGGVPTIARVAASYAAASAIVLGLVYGLERLLGLPDWVLPVAVVLLAVGLPIILATLQRERGRRAIPGVASGGGLDRWLTWRRAIAGGALAFGGLAVVVGAWAAMRALGIGPAGTLVGSGVLAERDRILLSDFADRTGDTTLAAAVTEAFRVDLGQSPTVTLVQPAELADVFQRMQRERPRTITADLAREVAVREGVKVVVAGEINPLAGAYVVSAQLLAPETGETLVALRETARDSTAIIGAVDRLSRRLRERIGESLRSIRETPPLDRVTTGSLPALRKYSEATRVAQSGEPARALALYQDAIALDTAFAAAYRGLAILLGNWGVERALAARSMAKAFQFRDRLTERERLWTTGSYYMQRGDPQAALVPYLSLLETEPDNARLLNNIGVLYTLQRENERALVYYERAFHLAPRSQQTAFNVIVNNLELGRFAAARAANDTFAAAVPHHPLLPVHRYLIAMAEFDYDSAQAAVDDWDPQNDPLSASVGSALRAGLGALRGRPDAVERELVQAEQRARDGRQVPEYLRAVIGAALYDAEVRGKPAEGMARVAAALRRFPLEPLDPVDRPYTELAEFYARAGRPERSRALLAEFDRQVPAEFRPAAQVDYDRAAAWTSLAEGRLDEALRGFRRADRGMCRICVLPGIAQVYEREGNTDSVLAVLERYVTTTDDDRWQVDPLELPGILVRLGQLYEARGDTARALRYDGRLLDLWRDAVPELQPIVAQVRDRVRRLAGERR